MRCGLIAGTCNRILCAVASGCELVTCFSPNRDVQGVGGRQVVPCGRCRGCRVDYSRGIAARCVHEASLHADNCFITLTYDDFHLPRGNTLVKSDFQKFMKRLRRRFFYVDADGKRRYRRISFYHSGEYGDDFGRPHYHALLFGFDFPDRVFWTTRNGNDFFTSSLLESLWGKGFCSVSDVTFSSAAYCARYVMKKVGGDRAIDHYRWVDASTGEVFERLPEYSTFSRRPAVGREWFDRFSRDVFPDEFLIVDGRRVPVPRYYRKLQDKKDGLKVVRYWNNRIKGAATRHDRTPERLEVRSIVFDAKTRNLRRDL